MMSPFAAQKAKAVLNPSINSDRNVSLVAFQIALCLVLRFALGFSSSPEAIQELAFLSLVVPAFFFRRFGLFDRRLFSKTISASFLYVVPLVLSFLFNLGELDTNIGYSAVTLINVIVLFFFGAFFASCSAHDMWAKAMYYVAPLAAPLFIYVAISQRHAYIWGRWEPYQEQPNWWGMMGLGLAWASLAWTKTVPRFFFLGIAVFFMLLTQARGSIVAFVPAFFFASGYFLPFSHKKMLRLAGVCAVILLSIAIISVATSHDIVGQIGDFFLNDVMRVNDPNRGIGSGMSGRTEAYATAWQSFEESPLFGSGYSEFSFVHNGFLLTLAESGIFALMGMLLLFYSSLSGYRKKNHLSGIGLIISYIFLLMTFPRSFNINMTSLMFVMVMMRGVALNDTGRFSAKQRKPLIGSGIQGKG